MKPVRSLNVTGRSELSKVRIDGPIGVTRYPSAFEVEPIFHSLGSNRPIALRSVYDLGVLGANSTLALVSSGFFAVSMASLHVMRRDLSPLERGMSRYAGADTLFLATTAFLALAVALLAVRTSLRRVTRAASHFVAAASTGLVVVVVTPIGDPPTSAMIEAAHTVGGLIFYLSVTSAMFLAAADDSDSWIVRVMSVALTLFLLGAVGTPGLHSIVGLLQRIVFSIVVVWIVRSALRRPYPVRIDG
jgi:hypothetical protein